MGPAGVMTQETAKQAACKIVMSDVRGCQSATPGTIVLDGTYMGIPAFDANGNGIIPEAADTLQVLCETYFGVTPGDASGCRRICGCAG